VARAFVQPGSHPIAANYGPNLAQYVPVAIGTNAPQYNAGHEVNMVNHTDSTSDVIAKANIPISGGGHASASAPMAGRSGKHLAKW
jgi:hypothetical protein